MEHKKENFLKKNISKQSTEDETYLYNMIRLFYTLLYKIGGFHAISGDTNNNGEMNKCWWTNKAS